MTDTIDLLDTIGSDASLRYASTVELTKVLQEAQASEALTSAAAARDSSLLITELGNKENLGPQAVQSPSHEEEQEAPLTPPSPEDN